MQESRTWGTALRVGLICPGSVWNSGVYNAGADHRIIVETMGVLKRECEAMSKRRVQHPKGKHDTEGKRGTAKLPWQFLELWPAEYYGL